MTTFRKVLQAGYIYAPYIPPIIQQVRSTLGHNQPLEPNCCAVCGKSSYHVRLEHEHVYVQSIMQGDYEGTPIDSTALRAMFCWDCFQASADSVLVENFKKHCGISGVTNERCLYCNKLVVGGHDELMKFFKVVFSYNPGDGKNSCLVDEDCYVENINV